MSVYDFIVHANDLPNMSMFKMEIERLGLSYKISTWSTIVPSFFTNEGKFDIIEEDGVLYFTRACHYALQIVHDDEYKDVLYEKIELTHNMLTTTYGCDGIVLANVSHRK